MKYIATIFFIFTSFFVQAQCEISTCEKILKLNSIVDTSIIKKSTCSDQINSRFIELINNSSGQLNTINLQSYLELHQNQSIIFSPKAINVIHIKNLLQEYFLEKGSSAIPLKIATLNNKQSFCLKQKDQIDISCDHCNLVGSKNIKLVVKAKTHWLNVLIAIKSQAFKSTRDLNRVVPLLRKKDFIKSIATSTTTKNYFSDIDNIHFYKLNNSLKKGKFLRARDLSPKILINYGQKVHFTINTNTFSLKATGIARNSGKFGDFIEVENTKTKKRFMAKVTNFNKVEIEL